MVLAVGQCQKMNRSIQNPMDGCVSRSCRSEWKLVTLVVELRKGQMIVVLEWVGPLIGQCFFLGGGGN